MIGQNNQLRFVACANMKNVGGNLFFNFYNCGFSYVGVGHYRLTLSEGVGEKQLQVDGVARDGGEGSVFAVTYDVVSDTVVDVFTRDGAGGGLGDSGFAVTLWSCLQPSEMFVPGGQQQ